MVLSVLDSLIGIVATALLAGGAVASRALTPPAGAVASVFGATIVVLGGFPFLALLTLFVIASVLATRYGFEEKQRRKVQEGTHGERGVPNVLAHIVLPTALVVVAWRLGNAGSTSVLTVLYASALAFGASDTFASEFGVLAGSARSILTGRPVPPGTNGGVSAVGEWWALVGALTTAVVAALLFALFRTTTPPIATFLTVVAAAGFLGCQADSILGETLENRGWLTKGSTNFFGMLASIFLAGGFLWIVGLL